MRWLLPVAAVAACAGPPQPIAAAPQNDRANQELASAAEPDTVSPQPEGNPERPLADECPYSDAALGRVARWLAESWSASMPLADASEIEHRLREEGGPYVWPHAWTLADASDRELRAVASPRLRAWLETFDDGGERRCGLSFVERSAGPSVVAAVAVDALADLAPIPANVRIGSWVDVRAEMRVPFSGAKVVVLGPRGAPRAVPTATNGQRIESRFAADANGQWLIQVLADVEHGPRPVLEALLMAGDEPRRGSRNQPAPGENITTTGDGAELLGQMLEVARRTEGLPGIAREKRLDQLASEQALALKNAQRVAHDLGTGDPEARAEAAGLELVAIGENVAHATSIARAHRALWSSPSHRSNILSPYFDAIGIGVAQDSTGNVWVCELFGRFAAAL